MAEEQTQIPITAQDRICMAIRNLPTLSLTSKNLNPDDSCAICLNGFASILDEEERNKTVKGRDVVLDIEEADSSQFGITQLVGCGHLFCRKDLIEWIRGFHGSCPTCRHTFLDVRPPSESDGESSDGDYFPNEEDEDEDDFIIDADADYEFEVEAMELNMDEVWEDSGMEDEEEESWIDSETTFSETDMNMASELDALAEDVADDTFYGIDDGSGDK